MTSWMSLPRNSASESNEERELTVLNVPGGENGNEILVAIHYTNSESALLLLDGL